MRAYLKASTAVVAIVMAGASAPGLALAADASGPGSAAQVDEVVVTASRREEKMQNVPIAVEALGGKTLTQLGVTDFSELIAYLPDVHDAGRGPGQQAVYIRGISTDTASIQAATSAGASPSVAIYLDDGAVSLPGRNLDVYTVDLQRVEVLEGPQGTLFGASSMGGAVRYITNKPNLSNFDASMKASYAETRNAASSESVQAIINIPVIEDKFAVRAVVFEDTKGGYIDNVAATYQMSATATGFTKFGINATNTARPTINNDGLVKNDFNPSTYRGARFSALYQVNPDWSVEVQDMVQTLDADGTFQYDPSIGLDKVARFQPDTLDDKFNDLAWNVKGRLANLDVVYTGSYINRKIAQQADYTHYANIGPYVAHYICSNPQPNYYSPSPALTPASCGTPAMDYTDNQRNTRITEELRASTPQDLPLRAVGGIYWDETRIYDDSDFIYQGSATAGYLPQAPLPGTPKTNPNVREPGTTFFNDILRSENQKAVFLQTEYDIIPKSLTLSLGMRYYQQTVGLRGTIGSVYYETIPGFSTSTTQGVRNLDTQLAGNDPARETGVIPRFNLSWKPAQDMLVYATYTEGFRPGGFNRNGDGSPTATSKAVIPYSYGTDTLRSFEIGWKTEWFNKTLIWNGSIYQEDWNKIQISVYNPSLSEDTFLENAADGIIRGTESNLTWRAYPGLTFDAALSVNDSKLTKVLPGLAGLRPVGSQLSLTPLVEGNLRARYEHSIGAYNGFLQLGTVYTGHSIASIIATSGSYLESDYNDKSYYLLNTSLGVTKDKWTAELYIENLTNQHPDIFTDPGDDVKLVTTARPFTAGVRLSVKY